MSARERVVDHAERLRGAVAQLGCSRSEALALAVLVAGAVAGLALLWAAGRGEAPSALDELTGPDASLPAAATEAAGDPAAAGAGGPGSDAAAGSGGAPGAGEPGAADPVVHVSGLVAQPGVYRVPGGARVADALQAAGGALPGARLDTLNLARPLADGEQIHVPGPGDEPAQPGVAAEPGQGAAASAWLPDGRLDINRATEADFEELPGIGPVLAERIVAHREEVGGFESIGDLLDVRGIGEKTLAALADLLAP